VKKKAPFILSVVRTVVVVIRPIVVENLKNTMCEYPLDGGKRIRKNLQYIIHEWISIFDSLP
jgi:hypothetical protein